MRIGFPRTSEMQLKILPEDLGRKANMNDTIGACIYG